MNKSRLLIRQYKRKPTNKALKNINIMEEIIINTTDTSI